jgi:outer membrane beta-barrel protein
VTKFGNARAAAAVAFFAAFASPVVHAELYQLKPLDGVSIEAVETYQNPKAHQLSLGIGIYPFDAYYTGLNLRAGYTQHLSQSFAWQIFEAAYFFPFQTSLTTQLASNFGVSPKQIETLNYIISTNAMYFFTYGKFIFLKDTIRYFRSSGLLGAGVLGTNMQTNFAANVGFAMEVFMSDSFSWKFSVRDSMTVPSFNQFVVFSLESGFSF